jgi:hypothetical protein
MRSNFFRRREPISAVILRSRALARRLEGWPQALVAHPSRLAAKGGEHLRMTKENFAIQCPLRG